MKFGFKNSSLNDFKSFKEYFNLMSENDKNGKINNALRMIKRKKHYKNFKTLAFSSIGATHSLLIS